MSISTGNLRGEVRIFPEFFFYRFKDIYFFNRDSVLWGYRMKINFIVKERNVKEKKSRLDKNISIKSIHCSKIISNHHSI